MATDVADRWSAKGTIFKADDFKWSMLSGRSYECRVLICPEEEGGFSAHALRLPGVVSQGETTQDAVDNIADAFQATIQSYLEDSGTIPWQDVEIERTKGCQELWILVNV